MENQGLATRLADRPLWFFFGGSLVAFVVSLAAYWILGGVVRGTWAFETSEDLAAPLALALGTAMAFGGSLVAIVIAKVALGIQRNEMSREALQSQVEMLRLLSEEVARFMEAYATAVLEVRKLVATIELHWGLIWTRLDQDKLLDPTYRSGPVAAPYEAKMGVLLGEIADRLDQISERLDHLFVTSTSYAIPSAILQEMFGSVEVELDLVEAQSTVSLADLPTLSPWLRHHAATIRGLVSGVTGDVLDQVLRARLMATSCRQEGGAVIDNRATLGLLCLGFLLAGGLDKERLLSGVAIRPPLTEILMSFGAAYSPERLRAALVRVFASSPQLAPIVERLAGVLQSPMGAEMSRMFDDYRALRPRLRMTEQGIE